MPKRSIVSPNLYAPPGGGMNSPVYETVGGRTLYVSGMLARAPSGEIVGIDDPAAQGRQSLDNLKSALAAAGATLGDAPLPAATLVIVSGLADPRALVEIEATAVVD